MIYLPQWTKHLKGLQIRKMDKRFNKWIVMLAYDSGN